MKTPSMWHIPILRIRSKCGRQVVYHSANTFPILTVVEQFTQQPSSTIPCCIFRWDFYDYFRIEISTS